MSFAVPSESYLIQSLEDLPAPVSGVITLPENRVNVVEKLLVLPDDTVLEVPDSSILQGRDAEIDGIQGNVDAPMIVGQGDGIVVTDLFLRNFSEGDDAFCVQVTNGVNVAGRGSRVHRVSVGGTRGVLVEDVFSASINVLDRSSTLGIALRGRLVGVQLFGCIHNGDGSGTPTYVELSASGQAPVLRISDAVYSLTPGSIGIDASGSAFSPGSLVRVGNCDFIPQGGTAVVPANLADLPGSPGVFFTGNSGTSDSTFGGQAGYNGNTGAEETVISAVGVIQPGGDVTNSVRIGTGNASNPTFTLGGASARVNLVQPGGADTAVLQWAALEAANCEVSAALSIRSADALQKSVAGKIVRIPLVGAPQFVAAFTGVTGGIFLSAGFLQPEGGISALQPGEAIAVEVANLTDTTNLIIDAVNLQLRSVD